MISPWARGARPPPGGPARSGSPEAYGESSRATASLNIRRPIVRPSCRGRETSCGATRAGPSRPSRSSVRAREAFTARLVEPDLRIVDGRARCSRATGGRIRRARASASAAARLSAPCRTSRTARASRSCRDRPTRRASARRRATRTPGKWRGCPAACSPRASTTSSAVARRPGRQERDVAVGGARGEEEQVDAARRLDALVEGSGSSGSGSQTRSSGSPSGAAISRSAKPRQL